MKPPRCPNANPCSKTQLRKSEEGAKRPVTVLACDECGRSDVTLKNVFGRKVCIHCEKTGKP